MPHLFEPLTLRSLTLKNRIMMAPMCMYSAGPEAVPTDWHRIHYPTRAVGGTGLIMLEATAVESRGRLSTADLGIYEDRHVEPLAQLVAMCRGQGAKVGIQIAHAGRKAWGSLPQQKGFGPETAVAPSAIPFDEGWKTPTALSIEEIDVVVAAFQQAARRALAAGFDVVEIHAAHGYLINEFLSPLTNHRNDQYGGSLQNRMRLLHRIVEAVREVWPERAPLFVRVSASDFAPGGIEIADMVEIAKTLTERGVDLIDCSSAGIVSTPPPAALGYQLPFAHRIKQEAGIATGAVGLITTAELADEIVRNQRADLVVLGRELLRNPYWPLQAARELGVEIDWPVQYRRAKR